MKERMLWIFAGITFSMYAPPIIFFLAVIGLILKICKDFLIFLDSDNPLRILFHEYMKGKLWNEGYCCQCGHPWRYDHHGILSPMVRYRCKGCDKFIQISYWDYEEMPEVPPGCVRTWDEKSVDIIEQA